MVIKTKAKHAAPAIGSQADKKKPEHQKGLSESAKQRATEPRCANPRQRNRDLKQLLDGE